MLKMTVVPIELDRARNLLYDVNAMIALGDELSLNLMTIEGVEKLFGKLSGTEIDPETNKPKFIPAENSFRQIRAIVWAGLLHEDETLTVRQVGAWLNPGNLKPVVEAYQKAWLVQDVTEPIGEAGPLAPPAPRAEAA